MNRVLATATVFLSLSAAPALAGTLDPPGPPAPTFKTLDEVPPTWSQILPVDQRFLPLMFGILPGCVSNPPTTICIPIPLAVLDRETGLVWERFPDPRSDLMWLDAMTFCTTRSVAGRKGWRLPTVQEMASLVPLPAGTPFAVPPSNPFTYTNWTSTTAAFDPESAWRVQTGTPMGIVDKTAKNGGSGAWCVRSGRGEEAQ